MELRHSEPSETFIATGGGAGLSVDHTCAHGARSLSLHLLGQDGKDLGVILPRCVAAGLVGAVLAYIGACEDERAIDDFLENITRGQALAAEQISRRLAERRAARSACCEAGHRTQGREHTCRVADPSA